MTSPQPHTAPLPRIAALIDGERNAAMIAERLSQEVPLPKLLQGFSRMADWGFIEPDWIDRDRPVVWCDEAAGTQELLGLLDGHLEAIVEASEAFPSPVFVYAGFAAQTDSGEREIYSGRGLTRRRAVISCLGEAAERISAGFHGGEELVTGRYADMAPAAVHPHDLLNFSPRQYAGRERWNSRHPGRQAVPHPFPEDAETAWVRARDLTDGKARLIPAAYVYFDAPGETVDFCRANSNGCASGVSLDDAVLRGFLELVERDAAAIWWYGRVPRPALDLAGLDEPRLAEIGAWHAERERRFHILDLTHDLEVPVFAAVSLDRDGGRIVFGFGADWDPQAAASAAATEMQQLFLSALLNEQAGRDVPDDQLPPETRAFRDWLAGARIADQPYLMPTEAAPVHGGRYRRGLPQDTESGLQRMIEICAGKGLEPLAVDLTRDDIAVPTARVIVPGLRHFWARFGPGRLYDVPVALGWRSEPCPEEALNPTPLFV